ncbi:MAG TPA: DUF3352 domain-containing protein [Chthoniobacteraceae bacterium]|nr:DUF3352 domain-containing protein [Chthoniobacteraceae bacterium]
MKRLVAAALVFAVLGASAFFFFKMRRFLPERARAAELAPAETIVFVQVPNLRQTALRFPQTDLCQIWREPDVQAFLEKPRRKAPWMREWEERFDEIVRVTPGEAFVAFTALDGRRVEFAGGFSFAGRRSQARSLVAQLREKLHPDGRSAEARDAGGAQFETFAFAGGQWVSCFRANWFLVASSAEALRALVERFEGKADSSLATDAVFRRTVAPLGATQDFVVYAKPESLSGQLNSVAALGMPKPTEPMAMATKIDGGKLHDTIFLPGIGARESAALSRRTLALAPPQALAYSVANNALTAPDAEPGWLKSILPNAASIEKTLAEKNLTWSDLPAAIGPETAGVVEWPEDTALPSVLLAAEIRDGAKARDFADAITSPAGAGSAWESEDHAGVTVFSTPPGAFAFARPALAVTDRFALLGLSREAVAGALPRLNAGSASLAENVAFQDIVRFVRPDATAFAYLDFRRLFERVYTMARPFVTLSLAFSGEAGSEFDSGKLPPVVAISKHLSAIAVVQSARNDGILIESLGTLTFPELLLGGAAAAASAAPDFPNTIPGKLKLPAFPSQKASPPPKSPAVSGAAGIRRTPDH